MNTKLALKILATSISFIGCTVLIGWIFDIPFLKSLSPNWVAMKVNTAFGFLLCGIVLLGFHSKQKIFTILSLIIALIGFCTLLEYLFSINLGIDQLVIKEAANTIGTFSPGRMAMITAVNFFLVGTSFFISLIPVNNSRKKFAFQLSQTLMIIVFFIALFSIYDYMLCNGEYYQFFLARYTLMAFQTAISFPLIAICFFLLEPNTGIASVVLGKSNGSVVFRRVLIPLFVILPSIFYLHVIGERVGWFNSGFGAVILITVVTAIIYVLMYFSAKKINKLDEEKTNQAAELLLAKERAEANDRIKSTFLANMSHEIRTPMNAILGFSELLNKENLPEEKKERYLKLINHGGKRLLNIISDIIDISKIDANQITINISACNINTIIDDLYSQFSISSLNNETTLVAFKGLNDVESNIETDYNRVAQILSNLLENAIKFTEHGTIEFGYTLNNDNLQFYVKDSGIGIAASDLTLIFERFGQAKQNSNHSGSGLGLSIAKGLTELLGGKIWTDSSIDSGTTFYFTIPYKHFASANIETLAPETKINDKKSGVTILIAEDDAFNFIYLEELLLDYNYTIIHALNGKEAVELFCANKTIDIILMDIKMPVMDGLEATKEIRKLNPRIPIIAQTAYAMIGDKEKALNAGCTDFISKPVVEQRKLIDLITKYIGLGV